MDKKEKELLFNSLRWIMIRLNNMGVWKKEEYKPPTERLRKDLDNKIKELQSEI